MGTPVSDSDAVTQLSLELEGLRISIVRSRSSPQPSGSAASSEASVGAVAPSEAFGASSASLSGAQGYRSGSTGRPSGSGLLPAASAAESRSAIEASFAPIPPHLLDSARALRSSVSTPEDRANRAWTAGLWAGAVLVNRAVTPNCTPPLQLPSRLYVVLRTTDSNDVRVTASRTAYLRLVDHHRGLSISHGWPTETEARIYTAGAGREFPRHYTS